MEIKEEDAVMTRIYRKTNGLKFGSAEFEVHRYPVGN